MFRIDEHKLIHINSLYHPYTNSKGIFNLFLKFKSIGEILGSSEVFF